MLNKVLQTLRGRLWRQPPYPCEEPLPTSFFIKEGYKSRIVKEYFDDSLAETEGVVHQPDVYAFAAFLARRLGCSFIIDLGCGRARKLVELYPEFRIVGVDHGLNIQYCRLQYPFGKWIECNFESEGIGPISRRLLQNAVIVCADVIEHLNNPFNLLQTLKTWLKDAPVAILTTPERDLARGPDDFGPPGNPSHVREWSLPELERLLESIGFKLGFSGLTVNNSRDREKKTSIVVLGNLSNPEFIKAPDDFRVVAFMTAFNEEDIIVPSISYLVSQGIDVYLIDNWSTDSTYDQARSLLGNGLIGIEKFPLDGPARYYEWRRLLGRVEELAGRTPANWFIHHDVDEIREAPWPEVRLKDAIYHVDRLGFNAIDHTVIEFHPTDNAFVTGCDFRSHFKFFEFGKRPGLFLQVKTWKNFMRPISLADSGGHEIKFNGRRVYPYKFLLKHYPIRSQSHGEKKVFLERKARYSPEEEAMGWHTHEDKYDRMALGYVFLKQPAELELFEKESFYKRYLIERISGIGIVPS